MSNCQGGGRVVKSETRTVTRNGVTETTKTEVIETFSSDGQPIRKTVTTKTTDGKISERHDGRRGSNSSSASSPDTHKKSSSINKFMGNLSLKSDKKEHGSDKKHHGPEHKSSSNHSNNTHSKGGRTHHHSSSDSSDSDSDEEDFAKVSLKQHNYYRSKHGVPKLKLNKSICNYAQEWAENCARDDNMRHRTTHKYGENIFMKWSSDPKHKVNGKEAVDSWYSEIKQHRYGNEQFSMGTGHFTQVVWRGSKEFGVGMARSRSGKIYVVANYDPPGNMIGSFTANVPPPK